MTAIRIRRRLDSDTLHLPELAPLTGRTVEILVREEPAAPPGFVPGTGDWDAFRRAAEALRHTYDYDALRDQDECDHRHAEDHRKRSSELAALGVPPGDIVLGFHHPSLRESPPFAVA